MRSSVPRLAASHARATEWGAKRPAIGAHGTFRTSGAGPRPPCTDSVNEATSVGTKCRLTFAVDPRFTGPLAGRSRHRPQAAGGRLPGQKYRASRVSGSRNFATGGLRRLNIRGLLALRTLRYVEADFLPLFEALEPLHVDRREVREQVFAAVIRRDEAITFRVVEPLDRAGCHTTCSSQE